MKNFVNFVLICLLSFFSCSVYAQQFNPLVDESQYPVSPILGKTIPLNPGFAILEYRLEPRGGSVVDANIIPSFTAIRGIDSSIYGWEFVSGTIGVDGYSILYSVISSDTIYSRSSLLPSSRLRAIQNILASKGLGTVADRQRFIMLLSSNISPKPVIFVHYIKPWVVIGFAIFLSLPMWWVIKRALR